VAAIIASDNVFATDSTILDGLSAKRKLSLCTRGDVGLHGPITSRTTPNRARSVGQAACCDERAVLSKPHPTSGALRVDRLLPTG
jgi:hypothetical protein